MDDFYSNEISPMLLSELKDPFNSIDWIYELKLDGIRTLAYLSDKTQIINKRKKNLTELVPELSKIHGQVKNKCILDGELIILKDGVPSFADIQKRALTTNPFKIELSSKKLPATFVAYDILYYDNHLTKDLPLEKRKDLLQSVIKENDRISISRFIRDNGIELFEIAKQQNLEGVVAKRLGSLYYFGKRTKDWIKFKFLQDEDFAICGYILKENNMTSFVLGQYNGDILIYKGHITLGASLTNLLNYNIEIIEYSPFSKYPVGNEEAVWLKPTLVCTVEYMHKTEKGGMRQPVMKGIRNDKKPWECIVKTEE